MFRIIGALLIVALSIFMLVNTSVVAIAIIWAFDALMWSVISGWLIGLKIAGED